jgi:hypothetical protein
MRFATAARRYSARDARAAAPASPFGALPLAADVLTPERTPARLLELSGDLRAALLMDASGQAAGVAGGPEQLTDDARALVEAADRVAPAGPAAELEVQFPRGAVYVVRRSPWVLAAVAGRGSLSSLVRWDMRVVLSELPQ